MSASLKIEDYRRLTDEERERNQWMWSEASRRGVPDGDLLFLSYDLFVAAIAADEHCYFGSDDGRSAAQDAGGDSRQRVWSDAEVAAAALRAHPSIASVTTFFGHDGSGRVLNSSTNVQEHAPSPAGAGDETEGTR